MKNSDIYTLRHRQMLTYQKSIAPFTLTLRELQSIWLMRTTSSVHYTLQILVARGLVITRKVKRKTHYYAVKK